MTRGIRVAGGDRLGKTIVFAKSQPHAEFIAQRRDDEGEFTNLRQAQPYFKRCSSIRSSDTQRRNRIVAGFPGWRDSRFRYQT